MATCEYRLGVQSMQRGGEMGMNTHATWNAYDGRRYGRQDARPQPESWVSGAEQVRGGMDVREPLPCGAQTPDFVTRWMQDHGTSGIIVVVRHVRLGLHEYLLDEVRRTDMRLNRIYLADHGVFRLNGDYLAPPRGRFSLLAPVGEALDAAVAGHTWMNGRSAFRRQLSAREQTLGEIARHQQDERE